MRPRRYQRVPLEATCYFAVRNSAVFVKPNPQLSGLAKVFHIWQRSQCGDDSTFIDPWLPNDYNCQMCAPERGSFQAMSINGSRSMTFVTNRFGDTFTRMYRPHRASGRHLPSDARANDAIASDHSSAARSWSK